jgi:chromosomal replication initiator protein
MEEFVFSVRLSPTAMRHVRRIQEKIGWGVTEGQVIGQIIHDAAANHERLEALVGAEKSLEAIMPYLQVPARHFGVGIQDILGDSRRKRHAVPRHVAMYFARQIGSFTCADLGRTFNRDHSSVVHAIQSVHDRARVDAEFGRVVHILGQQVRAVLAS